MTEKNAIEILNNEKPSCGEKIIYPEGERCEAYDMAIKALEKQMPKEVKIKKWSPAKCPNCGTELSESLGDGYYRHPTFLKRCPNEDCGQLLDWGDN